MAGSKSSSRWLTRQNADPYVARARSQGYRSRAVYKLQEIDRKYRIFSANQFIVDLGAAPGGWCQYIINNVEQAAGRVFALDRLAMAPIKGVQVIQGDFTEMEPLNRLLSLLEGQRVHLVLSDMAPNISGNRAVDQPKSMHLAELALDFARQHLIQEGAFVVKLFQGRDYADYLQQLRSSFKRVDTFKPQASRKASKEMYAVARNFSYS